MTGLDFPEVAEMMNELGKELRRFVAEKTSGSATLTINFNNGVNESHTVSAVRHHRTKAKAPAPKPKPHPHLHLLKEASNGTDTDTSRD
jgi:hypothetical protein